MRRQGERFYMPRTFGEDAGWYRNLVAAGSCRVTYLGRDYTLVNPRLVDYDAAQRAFPRYERWQFRLLGINQFVSLCIASRASIEEAVSYRKEA